ncbi:MAG: 23S rRNA (uracil(1939)-C(5))-methyltransferase RlmD [Chlamydiae bacterium]|nr:23S rRNA (uracil(1939)-C(5))-methyltransferase RlmD [Chlamydiota bacterium]
MEELEIISFSKKGYGVAYFNSTRVEIPNTIIGDKVLAELNKKRKGFIKARPIEILVPSPFRSLPKCSHIDTCGGCTFQEMSYEKQLLIKQEQVKKIFSGFDVEIFPIVPCLDPYYYRNKMEFTFSQNRKNDKFLGLMIKSASKYVFNVSKCHIAPTWMSDVLNAVRLWWLDSNVPAYTPWQNQGLLRTLILREAINTKEKLCVLTVSNIEPFLDAQNFVKAIISVDSSINIILRTQIALPKKPTEFKEELLFGKKNIQEELQLPPKNLFFNISASSFFQPNTIQAQKIYAKAISLATGKIVYDLYCGTGTLGMAFSATAEKVIGIEQSPDAVKDALDNIKLNNITNYTIYQGDVGSVLSEKNLPKPDIIIVDPPRNGLDDLAIDHIIKLNPKTLIYISCNPLTQLENIEKLKQNFKLIALYLFDQFPHTFHIENIALLQGF